MNLVEAVKNAKEKKNKETVVNVKIGGKPQKVRLKSPTYGDVMLWGQESGEQDQAVRNTFSAAMLASVVTLKHTLVVDAEQPALDEEGLNHLVRETGGTFASRNPLLKAARDIMWEASGVRSKDLEAIVREATAEGDEALAVPLESLDGTT